MSKNKIKSFKRIVKPPSQSVVLSLMALILIVGAPAIVSMIDDSVDISDTSFVGVDESKTSSMNMRVEDTAGNFTTVNGLTPSENNGTWALLLSSAQVADLKYVNLSLDFDTIVENPDVLSIYAPGLTTIRYVFSGGDGTPFLQANISIGEDGYGIVNFSPVDIVKLKSGMYTKGNLVIVPGSGVTTDLIEVTVLAGSGYTIPISSIIIGGAGVVLMLCALFATPWFGLGGITAKPRRSK